jgi:hypothetical protein
VPLPFDQEIDSLLNGGRWFERNQRLWTVSRRDKVYQFKIDRICKAD